MRILTISPHCDDVELAMGGTILKHRDAGDAITIAVIKSDDDLAGDVITRKIEQDQSAKILKAEFSMFTLSWTIERIVEALDKNNPDTLYFPFPLDTHQDHAFAAQVGLAVSRNVKNVFQYISMTSYSYYPNYLSVIDMGRKRELLSVFKSQITRNPKLLEIVEGRAHDFGSLVPGNNHFAEGFVVFRQVQ